MAGGNAVAVWVTRVDEAAVRNTSELDLLIRRTDLEAVKTALAGAGFVYRRVAGLDMFLAGPDGKAREAIHLIFAGEKAHPDEEVASPDVSEVEPAEHFPVLSLPALFRIKLTTVRDKDRTHLRDLIDLGLIDATWPARLAPTLGARLLLLLDTPGR